MKKKFNMIEEENIVIYDEGDDYDPGEDEIIQSENNEDGSFRLLTNEEIFTDEYMQNYAKKMDKHIAREKRIQRLISVGVVVGIVLFITVVSYINFRKII